EREDIEHSSHLQLIGDREGDDGKLGDRGLGFKGEEGQPGFAVFFGIFRQEGAFGGDILAYVEEPINRLEPQRTQPGGVGAGVEEVDSDGGLLLDRAVFLGAEPSYLRAYFPGARHQDLQYSRWMS